VVGNGLVDQLEGTVGGFLSIVRCRRKVEDDQPISCRVRFRKDCFPLGFLLALNLRELLHLFLDYLCIGGRRVGWGEFCWGR
jgi:hypothetical protein